LEQAARHLRPPVPSGPNLGKSGYLAWVLAAAGLPTGQSPDLAFEGHASQGVAVVIKATHHCTSTRGIHKSGTDLVTSRMLGVFRENAITRQEFLGLTANATVS
jgi:hypothetical protein